MKIAILQLDFIVGDMEGNTEKILSAYKKAVEQSVDLVVTSELAITGYPPHDLLQKTGFIQKQYESLKEIQRNISDIPLIVGYAERNSGIGKPLFNSVAFIQYGRIMKNFRKILLPTYDVFLEKRYFEPNLNSPVVIEYKGERIAITICEDIWNIDGFSVSNLYLRNPIEELKQQDPDILINISASPYEKRKGDQRLRLLTEISEYLDCTSVYVNQVGGNDELIFDGRSFSLNSEGLCQACAKPFEEDVVIFDTEADKLVDYASDFSGDPYLEYANILGGLVLGVRDYAYKCGFEKVLIGLSGGIDSTLVAVIAKMALGADNVLCFSMPSEHSSLETREDAKKLARNLSVEFREINIEQVRQAYAASLMPFIGDYIGEVTDENIQPRIRANFLMAVSNKLGYLLLTTGNKSEMAVGYCTLYGDMSGGLAAISDIPKTLVFKLARYINRDEEIIPWSIIQRLPSAELKPNQKDTDSLPSYEILDPILYLYINKEMDPEKIVARGFDPAIVERVVGMVVSNEYKRRQAPPGLKITSKAFGSGRILPIARR